MAPGSDAKHATRTQLRIYDIEPGLLDAFVAAWTTGVVPLRERFGFEVEGWTVAGVDRFVWLLTYRGEGTFEEANEAYYASPERAQLDPDPAAWIVGQTELWLEPTTDARAGNPRA
jgi:NIPSNAP protein